MNNQQRYRQTGSDRTLILKALSDSWCLANCDSYKERELDGVNTVVCE